VEKLLSVTENDAVGVTGAQYNRQQLLDFIWIRFKAILPELKASRNQMKMVIRSRFYEHDFSQNSI
jgi:hypothetical protein